MNIRIAALALIAAASIPVLGNEAKATSIEQAQPATPIFGAGLALPGITLSPGMALPGWSFRGSAGGMTADPDGFRTFTMRTGNRPDSPVIEGRARFAECAPVAPMAGSTAIRAEWSVVPTADASLLETFVACTIPGADITGGYAVVDGAPIEILLDGQKPHLFRGAVTNLAFRSPTGAVLLDAAFDNPTRILIQDGTSWGLASITLRIFFAEGDVKGGQEYSIKATFATPAAGDLALGNAREFIIKAGADWIPLANEPMIEPGSALDFSNVIPHHAPAGKYDRVVAVGDHFEFADLPGVPQRFYGVNICGDANTPSTMEAAARFAANLARIGYNTLRIHHHERQLVSKTGNRPCAESAGGVRGEDSPRRLPFFDDTLPDPDRIALFDNLVAACIDNGIYLTTDLFVSRSHLTTWRSLGIDRDGCISSIADYKILCAFWEPAYSNLLAWSRNFLTHVNPHTGRSLAEEPALATLALINEGNLGNYGAAPLRDLPCVQQAWDEWIAANPDVAAAAGLATGAPAPIPDDLYADNGSTAKGLHSAAFAIFLTEAEMRLAERLRAFVRDELRCPAPLSSLSSWYNPVQYQLVREKCFDYVDDHFYVDHPLFLDKAWTLPSRCPNTNPMSGGAAGARSVVFRRLMDKPFCLTEWNYSGPGRYRGVGGIATGALGALQNWSGMWRFAWSHGRSGVEKPETKALGYFDMSGDPLGLAAERAALCLFLRGDLAPLPVEYPVEFTEGDLLDPRNGAPRCEATGWLSAAWQARLGSRVLGNRRGDSSPRTLPAPSEQGSRTLPARSFRDPLAKVRQDLAALGADKPGNGAISIDPATGTFLIDTPCTAGGFAEAGAHQAGPVKFELLEVSRNGDSSTPRSGTVAPATVWASSLDGRPLAESSHILVTHLTDVQNSGIRYGDAGLTILLDWGKLPHLMRNGAAEIELAFKREAHFTPQGGDLSGEAAFNGGKPAWRVYRLSPSGRRLGEIPATVSRSDDSSPLHLSFTARTNYDPASASFLYEVVRGK